MGHFSRHKLNISSWLFPILATMGLLLLFLHKSKSPAVLDRYSVDYAVLLILYAVNVGVCWSISVFRGPYQELVKQLSLSFILSLATLVGSFIFLVDFAVGSIEPDTWVSIALVLGIGVQLLLPRSQHGTRLIKPAVVAGSLVFSVILAEAVVSFFLLENLTPKSQGEFLDLMHSQWPKPIPIEKPAGTFRILGLADSFGTWGGADNYHYTLEDLVRQEGSPRVQMINVSVPGYELWHQLSILPFAMAYSPDLVIHGFFVGNDFNSNDREIYQYQGIYVWRESDTFRYSPHNFLIRPWAEGLATYFRRRREQRDELEAKIVDKLGTHTKQHFAEIQFARMQSWGGRNDQNIARMKKILTVLDDIRSVVEKNGARYVMVIHPDQTQVSEPLRREIIRTFQVKTEEYDIDLPQQVLRSYCAEKRIPCLDLLPIFRAARGARHGGLYSLLDTHYNEAGNDLAAATINRFLRENNLLPAPSPTVPDNVQRTQ